MKKQISLLFVLIIILLCYIQVPMEVMATSLTKVTFNDVAARKGDTIEISVSLTDCKAFKSMAVVPLYDPDRLEYISGEWLIGGALLSDWNQEEQNGVILYSSETVINGEIAKFVFKMTNDSTWEDIEFTCRVILKNGNSNIEVEVTSLKIFVICDHLWGEEIYTQPPSCTKEGYTYKTCTICYREETVSEIERTAHRPSDWIIDRESTLYERGLRHKECLDCYEILEQESIPMLGECDHVWSEEVFVKEATYSEFGMVYRTCQICGEHLKLFNLEKLGMKPWIVALIAVSTGVVAAFIVFIICFCVFRKKKVL